MSKPNPALRAARGLLTPTACAVLALLAGGAPAALAQDQRVEITGSSIKRIDGETALPVQVITREAIDKTGATTAAELMRTITANTAPLSDGVSITDGTSGQRGFNGANLRGLGVSSTLILLNGRRMANFATPGDNAGVDLNNIPAAALARVEVLTDGASAIYGTEAIGGVINFITRKDYEGVDLGLRASATQEGGAGKRTATLSGGLGNLDNDGFNVFGVVDVQQLDSLRSTQRQFIQDRPLATNLPALMSSRTFPANIRLTRDQRNLLQDAGVTVGGQPIDSRTINFSVPGCNPPANVFTPDGPGGVNGCSYDYMQDTEIYPEADKLSFLGRATLKINNEHQLFAEALFSRTKTTYVLSPNPIVVSIDEGSRYYPTQLQPLVDAGDSLVDLRLRMTEAGNRSNEVTSDANRIVIGATGLFGDWEYTAAISRAENKATDRYVNGYVLFDEFQAAVADGRINPLGASDAAGQALLDSIRISDDARKSKGVSTAIDARGSRPVFKLGGGDAMLAVGGEVRRETTEFRPSALLLSNNIAGDRDSTLNPGEVDPGLQPTDDSRNIGSLYAELWTPFSRELEAQWALRFDHYSGGVGSTVNPKASFSWRPMQQLKLRGSAGTGFRAPSLADLNRPTIFGTTSSLITDPQCVEVEGTIDGCTDQWNVKRESNPDLKPEKSRQFSLGTVVQATGNLSFNADYFYIKVKDIISTLGEQTIINNPAKYNGTYIQRDAGGFIEEILLRKENQGELETSGIDLGVDWRGAPTAVGRFSASATGTYVLKYDRQFGADEPSVSNLGRFLNDQVIQRWRHRISAGWDYGSVGLTLSNSYSSGYTDQNTTYDPVSDSLLPQRKVESYSLWDLAGSWNPTQALKLRAGVLNLLDTDPPFSNQAYFFLAGYDPTYTDPRGRSYYVSLNYTFK
jgi:iron complex outermembrane recepter protein